MLSTLNSASITGINPTIIQIEADVFNGMPGINIVGLPDAAVRESKDRIRSAIVHSGYSFPGKKITVNLAPANIKKIGSGFDLPIALGILIASDQLSPEVCETLSKALVVGELSLNGQLRRVNGVLSIAKMMSRDNEPNVLVIPEENKVEGQISNRLTIFTAPSLRALIDAIGNGTCDKSFSKSQLESTINSRYRFDVDFADIKGQYHAKRAIEIAAAGNHNLLMVGPPGSGKTMLAKRIPTILPKMTIREIIETSEIYSCDGLLEDNLLLFQRPFRSPHHTASDKAIIGGGSIPKPGEVSLAHNGVLFLDEFAEFQKNVIEVLRQPLEDKKVTIARVDCTTTFPAKFMLVAAMNPCPCGYLTDQTHSCHCKANQLNHYINKLSGPMLDRFDISVDVPRLPFSDLINTKKSESSESIRKRIESARNLQYERYKEDQASTNAELSHRLVEKYCNLNANSLKILSIAINKLGLSARGYDKILKVSRTIADLDNREAIEEQDLLEALQFRSYDRTKIMAAA